MSRKSHTLILPTLMLALVIVFGGHAVAVEQNLNDKGLALHGYDPMSYFEASAPKKGSKRFTAQHDGATYYFATAENRDKFQAEPNRFAPQFGGYCAHGVRVGRKFDIDPEVYRVVDDKLYVQLNWGTQVVWLVNLQENIDVAHEIWPMIEARSDAELEAEENKKAKNKG